MTVSRFAQLSPEQCAAFAVRSMDINNGLHRVFVEGRPNQVGFVTVVQDEAAIEPPHQTVFRTLSSFDDLVTAAKEEVCGPGQVLAYIRVYDQDLDPQQAQEDLSMGFLFYWEEHNFFLDRDVDDWWDQRFEDRRTPYQLHRRLILLLAPQEYDVVSNALLGQRWPDEFSQYLHGLDDETLVNFVMYHLFALGMFARIMRGRHILCACEHGLINAVITDEDAHREMNILAFSPFNSRHEVHTFSGPFPTELAMDLDRKPEALFATMSDTQQLLAYLKQHFGLGKASTIRQLPRHHFNQPHFGIPPNE